MKPLYRSAVTLTFLTIIGIVSSVLFAAMKRLHIESWFFFNPSITVGFLSGFLLVCIISLGNIHHLRRRQAKDILSNLDGFSNAAESIRGLFPDGAANLTAPAVPEPTHQQLMRALAVLDERTGILLRGERLAFVKGTTIQRWNRLCSPLARTEFGFYEAFAPIAESASAAYRTLSILPYLADEPERITTQNEFLFRLQALILAIQPESALEEQLRNYRAIVDHFIGARRVLPKDTPHGA